MTAQLSPTPVQQFFDNNGAPLFRGTLATYAAGTTTPQETYVDSTQTTQNTNPITLNYRGECNLWLDPTLSYKFVLKDFFGNTIWTVDNIQGGFTPSAISQSLIPVPTDTWTLGDSTHSWEQLYLGANASPALDTVSGIIGYYPRTPAEITAGVTPTNNVYAPGDLRRYGADPTGVADSSTALTNAIAANSYVFDGYPGGGSYLFASTVVLKSVLHLSGSSKTIGAPTRGTTFTLGSAAGSTASLLHGTAFISDVEIDHITFTWQDFTKSQRAIQFEVDCRTTRIHDCAFMGSAVSTTQSIGINFVGGGTFTGDVTVEKNYFSSVLIGIAFAGSCSTVRVISNEMYSSTSIPSTIGINNVSTGGGGLVIAFNTFEAWNQAIVSSSGGICQVKNYFEANVTWDMNWGSSTNNSSFGDFCTGSPLSSFLYNNTSANVVLSAFGYFMDSGTLHAYRGFSELGLTANLGYYTDYTPTVAAGAGTLTGTSISFAYYSRKGGEMTVHFNFSSTLSGSATNVLTISIAGGLFPSKNAYMPCSVTNAGSTAFGLAYVTASGAVINIGLGPSGSGNFTNGTVGAFGQITLRIIS